MKKQTVRSGIVGCGFSGSFHYNAVQKVYGTDADCIGVFDNDQGKCREFASERDIRAFGKLEDLLSEVDLVHVCVTATAHETVAVQALEHNLYAIVEKPLTGYFGDGSENFSGDTCSKETALEEALGSVRRMLAAEEKSDGRILYAENWIYAPAIQKEREIIEKTGSQILWMHGEEAHSGSHAKTYAHWKYSGGGVMMGKGCHPLTAALYLKRVEGKARTGDPIRPKAVSARTHAITRLPDFIDTGHLRSNYHDIDDFSMMHVVFEDETVGTVFASDIVMGGIHNWLEISTNNHRTVCNINPNTAMQTYNPEDANFQDIYIVEKTGTKQGWSCPSPDEDWFTGYPQEIEAFYRTAAYGDELESDSALATDCIATIYSAYVSAERKGAEVEVQLL